jgi:hypothetical protein
MIILDNSPFPKHGASSETGIQFNTQIEFDHLNPVTNQLTSKQLSFSVIVLFLCLLIGVAKLAYSLYCMKRSILENTEEIFSLYE